MKTLLLSLLLPVMALAANTDADFDSLGGNKVILDRAKALAPEQSVSVVQNRAVSRTKRLEISPEFSGSFGGDAYVKTKTLAMNLNFHINPRISLGFKYENFFNELTPEGNYQVDRAISAYEANPAKAEVPYPKVNYAKNGMMLTANWYPMYGKLNLMEKAVTQFDVYLLGGIGQISLETGSTNTYTGGLGLGFWLRQNLSARAEMRYQNYKAKYFDEDKNMDLAIASFQMGWLL